MQGQSVLFTNLFGHYFDVIHCTYQLLREMIGNLEGL